MFGKDDKKSDVVGFIGKGMFIEGRLEFEDTVRIDGRFKGRIDARGTLVVGDNGCVEGEVTAGAALVTGTVKGTLEATKVELKAPAKVLGDIKTPTLIIGEGVVFEGRCLMVKRDQVAETVEYGQKIEAAEEVEKDF